MACQGNLGYWCRHPFVHDKGEVFLRAWQNLGTFEALCVAFSPDGKTLASGAADGKINLWDVQPGK